MTARPLAALRPALRSLASSPGFALAVIATFALGIGVNTAVFSAAWSLLLAPLPLREPDRLVAIYETFEDNHRRPIAPANFLDWRRESKTLEGAASYFQLNQVLVIDGAPNRISVAQVSSQYFDVLGPRPAAGRFFRGGERRPAAVVAKRFWDERLGGGPIEGRSLLLGDQSFDVVGLAPESFGLPQGVAIWTLAEHDVARLVIARELDPLTTRDARYLGAYGRLVPGATLEGANAELEAIGRRLELAFPNENRGCGVRAYSLADDLGNTIGRPVALLAGGSIAMLILTCANVAGLLLARGLARRREIAVRAALGAGRAGLVGHSVAESALLAIVGGALGIALAAKGAPLLVGALPGAEVAGRPIGVPLAVILFATLLAALAATTAAVAPALSALRLPASAVLAAGRGSVGPARTRLRSVLVVAQAGLAVLLVAGALLLLRTLDRLIAIDPGFDARGVSTIRLWAPSREDFPPQQRAELLTRAVAVAAESPGVERAGAILKLPLTGASFSAGARVEGRAFEPGQEPDVCWRVVTDDYFRTLAIPLLAGRFFEPSDAKGELVGLVNQTLARQIWPGEDAVGKRLATGLDVEEGSWVTVVGVVGDTPHVDLVVPPSPELYRPLLQANRFGSETVTLAVRAGPGFSAAALRDALHAVSPELVLEEDRPLSSVLSRATARERLLGVLLGIFAALALALAGIGLYGVLSLLVAERRRELGLRLAVGAKASDLGRIVLQRAAAQALLGAAFGLPAALAAGRLLGAWLYEISPADPVSLGGAVVALLAIAAVAAWMPARRAARLDPATVLRDE